LFLFLQAQALAGWPLVGAALLAAHVPTRPFGVADVLGVLIFAVGLAGEATADRQMARFRADPAKRGGVCDLGLWAYSRHPNYFFEWVCWLGYAFIAADLSGRYPWGWIAFAAPATMYWLLAHVSGVPPLEAHLARFAAGGFQGLFRAGQCVLAMVARRPRMRREPRIASDPRSAIDGDASLAQVFESELVNQCMVARRKRRVNYGDGATRCSYRVLALLPIRARTAGSNSVEPPFRRWPRSPRDRVPFRFPAESQYIPASFEASTVRVNNVAYLYKPMADLLGLIAESDAGAFGGIPDAPRTPDFLGDLSWLFAPRDAAGASDAAAPAASASPGLRRAPFSSILAANAAYESSMDLADE